jgi:hypothetical protein
MLLFLLFVLCSFLVSGVVVGTASGVASKLGTFVTNAAYVAATSIANNSNSNSNSSLVVSEPSIFQQFLSDPRTRGVINIASKSATAACMIYNNRMMICLFVWLFVSLFVYCFSISFLVVDFTSFFCYYGLMRS